jgi:hypothetical protein
VTCEGDETLRPLGYHTVIMARARARGRFGVVGPKRQRHGVPPAFTVVARRASGGSAPSDPINAGGARGKLLTSVIRTHSSRFILLTATRFAAPDPPVPFLSHSCSCSFAFPGMSSIHVLDAFP